MEALICSIVVSRLLPAPLSALPPQVSDGVRAHFRCLPAPRCPCCHALCTQFRHLNNTTTSLHLQPIFQCHSCSRTFLLGSPGRGRHHPYKPRPAAAANRNFKRKAPAPASAPALLDITKGIGRIQLQNL